MQDDRKKDGAPGPAAVDEDPFLIDPGNEDPGAGIDQLVPQPAPEDASTQPPERR